MIHMTIKIELKKSRLNSERSDPKLAGRFYHVRADGLTIGAYYAKSGELALEPIPWWMPTLEKRIREEVEVKLQVKVQNVSIFGSDRT